MIEKQYFWRLICAAIALVVIAAVVITGLVQTRQSQQAMNGTPLPASQADLVVRQVKVDQLLSQVGAENPHHCDDFK